MPTRATIAHRKSIVYLSDETTTNGGGPNGASASEQHPPADHHEHDGPIATLELGVKAFALRDQDTLAEQQDILRSFDTEPLQLLGQGDSEQPCKHPCRGVDGGSDSGCSATCNSSNSSSESGGTAGASDAAPGGAAASGTSGGGGMLLNQGILRLNHERVPALFELPVTFAPTYMRASQSKSPSAHKRTSMVSSSPLGENAKKSSSRYGSKRCPAWTDRVLMDSCGWDVVRRWPLSLSSPLRRQLKSRISSRGPGFHFLCCRTEWHPFIRRGRATPSLWSGPC